MHRLALIAVLAVATANCATSTNIVTEPPGAAVVREKDKVELGVTPYKYTTSMWIWESDKLNVTSKAGQSKSIEIKRTEIDLVPAVVAGGLTLCTCVCGVPVFLAGGFKLPETTKVEFDKKAAATESRPEQTPIAYLSPRLTPTGNVVY